LKLTHREKLLDTPLDTLITLSETQVKRLDATDCPLCDEWAERLQKINDPPKSDVSLKQFQRHLGRHMEQLALAVLPVNEEDQGNSDEDIEVEDMEENLQRRPISFSEQSNITEVEVSRNPTGFSPGIGSSRQDIVTIESGEDDELVVRIPRQWKHIRELTC
jgi:hypothetical protein